MPKSLPLLTRIKNGDYDYSTYHFQAQYELYLMNQSLSKLNKRKGKDYLQVKNEIITDHMRRYRHLVDDFFEEEHLLFFTFITDVARELKYIGKSLREREILIYRLAEVYDGTLEELYINLSQFNGFLNK